jgi:methionyl-tRNA formyltransferase
MLSTQIVFMGTPDFAVPALTALIKSEYQVMGVVTQPDRPSGRGKKLTPSAVKVVAEAANLPVLQPETLKDEEAKQALAALQPDLIVVAAFGQILRQEVLELPRHGCLNIHASLLPRWRGAAPVAAAILAGDAETGVTLMKMDVGLDTGPMIAHQALPITPDHTTETLTAVLAEVGATLLLDTLPDWLAGKIEAQPQDNNLATFAPRLKKEAGRIDWTQPAVLIERQVRAFDPWPGTFSEGPRGQLKVLGVELAPKISSLTESPPGIVFRHQSEIYITTGQGVLRLAIVQPAGKKPMTAKSMLNGQPELLGAQLE